MIKGQRVEAKAKSKDSGQNGKDQGQRHDFLSLMTSRSRTVLEIPTSSSPSGTPLLERSRFHQLTPARSVFCNMPGCPQPNVCRGGLRAFFQSLGG